MPRSSSHREEEAKRLRDLRALLNTSQRELAEHFGVAHGAIAQWEKGKRTIPGPVLRLMDIYEENLGMIERPVQRSGQKKLNSAWASRTWATSMTATKVAARLAGSSFYQLVSGNERASRIKAATQEAIADQLTDSLVEMKGLLMKVGQIASYMDFSLPARARETLARLQDKATPMEPAVVERILAEDFGRPPGDLFRSWENQPFAAASIGQVHRAVLGDGREVAVKVQYPGIAQAIESDLANAAVLERLTSVLFRNQDFGVVLEEVRERLAEECDYEREAANLKRFRELFRDDPSVVIPEVFPALCSKRVLTMELVRGRRFDEFAKSASRAERIEAGRRIYAMAFRSIFRHGIFNCDPHPGNYLFLDGKVAYLDFGCVKRFDEKFIRDWKAYIRAHLEGDRELAKRLTIRMGFAPEAAAFDFDHHFRMMLRLYEPWLTEGDTRFTKALVQETWRFLVTENPNKYNTNLPKDWIFTHRLQWGLYSVLAELGAEFDARSILLPLLEHP